MSEETSKKSTAVTPEFRVSYPNVFKAKLNGLNGKMEFSVTALFPLGEKLADVKALVKNAATAKWGPNQAVWPKNLQLPFRDQADREKEKDGKLVMPAGYVKGAIYLNLKNEQQPGLIDAQMQPIIDPNEFYGGCYARASVRAYAYTHKSGKAGVTLYLQNVQKTKDGNSFGAARVNPEDEFSPIEGAGAAGDGAQASASSAADLFD